LTLRIAEGNVERDNDAKHQSLKSQTFFKEDKKNLNQIKKWDWINHDFFGVCLKLE